MRYVALLGSVNVGGNRLKMAELKAALEAAGFAEVETVVASGNVLFAHPRAGDAKLAEEIAALLQERFGIASTVAVRSRAEIAALLAESPFANEGDDAGSGDWDRRVHVHVLTGQPSEAQFAQLAADHAGRGNEVLAPGTRALHIDFVDGVANSKLTGSFMDRRLGHKGTARNLRSLRRILEKLGG
jgi:uncharacterized protein (DUF1697 family)